MREYGSNINLPSLDNLFSSEQERQDAKLEKIQILPLTELDRKSTRLNSSHSAKSRMPSSA